jgi:hypothetical protein
VVVETLNGKPTGVGPAEARCQQIEGTEEETTTDWLNLYPTRPPVRHQPLRAELERSTEAVVLKAGGHQPQRVETEGTGEEIERPTGVVASEARHQQALQLKVVSTEVAALQAGQQQPLQVQFEGKGREVESRGVGASQARVQQALQLEVVRTEVAALQARVVDLEQHLAAVAKVKVVPRIRSAAAGVLSRVLHAGVGVGQQTHTDTTTGYFWRMASTHEGLQAVAACAKVEAWEAATQLDQMLEWHEHGGLLCSFSQQVGLYSRGVVLGHAFKKKGHLCTCVLP